MLFESLASGLAGRLRRVRRELYGDHGACLLARQVGISTREWLEFEAGESLPAWILERLVAKTAVDPIWLLRGVGPIYRPGVAGRPAPPAAPVRPPPAQGRPAEAGPTGASPLVGRRVRVPAWAELGEVLDLTPVGIIVDVYDLGRGPLARIRGEGFELRCEFALEEIELLD